jgi:hypothetical protein
MTKADRDRQIEIQTEGETGRQRDKQREEKLKKTHRQVDRQTGINSPFAMHELRFCLTHQEIHFLQSLAQNGAPTFAPNDI